MPHTFKEIFGEGIGYTVDDDSIDSAFVNCCDLDVKNRTLSISLQSNNYISEETLYTVKKAITKGLGLNRLDLSISFSKECFCLDACKDIVARIRRKSAMLNGFFNKADFSLDNHVLTIELKFGGLDALKDFDFEKRFSDMARK